MSHKHGFGCLEVVSGKTVCIASGKEVVRRGPRMRPGYAFEYQDRETEWDRVSLSYGDDWETVMTSEPTTKGAKHMGLLRLTYRSGGDPDHVWRARDGRFYAQTHIPRSRFGGTR